MSVEHKAPVEAPLATAISVTLSLGAWHRIAAILRRAPYEDVSDLLADLIAQADPQITAAARAYVKDGKLASRLISAPSSRAS